MDADESRDAENSGQSKPKKALDNNCLVEPSGTQETPVSKKTNPATASPTFVILF